MVVKGVAGLRLRSITLSPVVEYGSDRFKEGLPLLFLCLLFFHINNYVMKNLLNSIQVKRPDSNVFDLTHDHKTSLNMGYLVPTMVMEAIPGDKFSLSAEHLCRLAPLVAPMMHRLDVRHEYFFVPYRLLWEKWEMFITDKKDPIFPPAFPTTQIEDTYYGLLADYLGIPNPIGLNTETVSAMPFAAYQFIWNEYYRDQNLQEAVEYKLIDGDNSANLDLRDLRKRCWEHDYFTASLPFAQKGEAVTIPVAGFEDVPVKINNPSHEGDDFDFEGQWIPPTPDDPSLVRGGIPSDGSVGIDAFHPYAETSSIENGTTTINDLRRANALQRFLEKLARGGSRYVETIYAMFGVKSPDARLQRPEYITGVKTPIAISEVLNTTGTEQNPQGNMAGHGIAAGQGNYGSYFVQEHGLIMCMTSVMPRTAYQQGIPKMFLKTTSPYEYFFPDFAHIGEQEVKNKEIFAFQGATGDATFGYTPRYAEYKVAPSQVSGDFRTSLAFWHMGRIFASAPALNAEFVECTPREDVFAVTDPEAQKIYMHIQHRVRAIRRMPKFGTPSW